MLCQSDLTYIGWNGTMFYLSIFFFSVFILSKIVIRISKHCMEHRQLVCHYRLDLRKNSLGITYTTQEVVFRINHYKMYVCKISRDWSKKIQTGSKFDYEQKSYNF